MNTPRKFGLIRPISGPFSGLQDVAEDGRFMACTGGWDWAPYSYTSTNSSGATTGPANTLSKGIWKSVYTTDIPRVFWA